MKRKMSKIVEAYTTNITRALCYTPTIYTPSAGSGCLNDKQPNIFKKGGDVVVSDTTQDSLESGREEASSQQANEKFMNVILNDFFSFFHIVVFVNTYSPSHINDNIHSIWIMKNISPY